VVTETSPGNYQAWVRVAAGPIREELATAVARELAWQYGGDPASAHWRHLGRLAGFTNNKPSRVLREGPYQGLPPFVLLRDASGRVAPAGAALLERAAERLAEPERLTPERSRTWTWAPLAGQMQESEELGALYRAHAQRLRERVGGDLSRLDWAVAQDLRAQGHSAAEVAGAVLAGSPYLAERKAGHVQDYVERTVAKVFAQAGLAERAPGQGDQHLVGSGREQERGPPGAGTRGG
jgi:hypothetical protein